ncbi:MAG: kinase-regulated stress-responsive transcription factor skn7 [Vezdaea aestivalis]|nr:MAG: kinase-regulated stress-responsive transcription factor skn7 [Vezdaea aestivalis]
MDSSNSPAIAANNSSDFVRKLYKMLEDPSYEQVVRWGDAGDSFVVLENEKFTKSILPKHFKHSNFASFVRQLNKYDFHKVRHNNEENGQSSYGPGAWEFRHPEFKMNNKDSLDNIRRKAPAPRKPAQVAEELVPTQQMDLVNTQLGATQQQLQSLQDRYNELSMHHSMLLQELISVQKTVVNHEQVMQNVMGFLHSVDAHVRSERRNSKTAFEQNMPPAANGPPSELSAHFSPVDDIPASPLQNATKLLNDTSAGHLLNQKNLENMNDLYKSATNLTTPPPDNISRTGALPGHSGAPHSANSSTSMGFSRLSGDLSDTVYPAGHNIGINPMFSEHIHNIPYPMPTTAEADSSEPRRPVAEARKKSTSIDPGWVRAPQILLVEDDPTCRRIGGKFLYSFKCHIDSAFDGLEAVNKMNAGSKYDLVLMDIIMPNLDGVSACHLIRQFDSTPIIAMTSNIRSDDISMYFSHGMNDVLPKPFTKEGLLTMLEKHLGHLKKADMLGPQSMAQTSSIRTQIKDESSPTKSSPSTAWHSPNQLTGVSPSGHSMGDEYMHAMRGPGTYSLEAPTEGGQYSAGPAGQINSRSGPHRRQVSDMTAPDDIVNDPKRQRMYAPPTTTQMGYVKR